MDSPRITKYGVLARRKDGTYEEGQGFKWIKICETLSDALAVASLNSAGIPDRYDNVGVHMIEFVAFGFGDQVATFHADCSQAMGEE